MKGFEWIQPGVLVKYKNQGQVWVVHEVGQRVVIKNLDGVDERYITLGNFCSQFTHHYPAPETRFERVLEEGEGVVGENEKGGFR